MSEYLTVQQWQDKIASTESLVTVTVPFDGTGGLTVFSLPSGWNLGLRDAEDLDLTEAKMRVGDDEYSLTKIAILTICNRVGIPSSYVFKTPGPMIQTHLNYWASHSTDLILKFLTRVTVSGPEILAVTKENITPFSNLTLLSRTVSKIEEIYGGPLADTLKVDFKSHHDLGITSLRLLIPHAYKDIAGDIWCAGIQIRNSLTGKVPLSVSGYLTNLATQESLITLHAASKYNRKIQGQNLTEVYDWVSETVGTALDAQALEFESLEAVTEEDTGSLSKVLADVFRTYKVPLKIRNMVIDDLEESGDTSYYGLTRAIAAAANAENLPEHFVTAALEVAGDVMHSASQRCSSCARAFA